MKTTKTNTKQLSQKRILRDKVFIDAEEFMGFFGIRVQTFNKWKKTRSFPQALCLTKKQVWDIDEVMKWAKSHRINNPLSKELREADEA